MKSHPEVIELDEVDLHAKLDQIAAALGDEMARPFRQLLDWYACLLGLLREKKISLGRLRRMLFGATTERSDNVLPSTPPIFSPNMSDVPPKRVQHYVVVASHPTYYVTAAPWLWPKPAST